MKTITPSKTKKNTSAWATELANPSAITTIRKAVRRMRKKVAAEKPEALLLDVCQNRRLGQKNCVHTNEKDSKETAIVHWSMGRVKDMMSCPNRDGKEAGMSGEDDQSNKMDC